MTNTTATLTDSDRAAITTMLDGIDTEYERATTAALRHLLDTDALTLDDLAPALAWLDAGIFGCYEAQIANENDNTLDVRRIVFRLVTDVTGIVDTRTLNDRAQAMIDLLEAHGKADESNLDWALSDIIEDGVDEDDRQTGQAQACLAQMLTQTERTSPLYAAALGLVPVISTALTEKVMGEVLTNVDQPEISAMIDGIDATDNAELAAALRQILDCETLTLHDLAPALAMLDIAVFGGPQQRIVNTAENTRVVRQIVSTKVAHLAGALNVGDLSGMLTRAGTLIEGSTVVKEGVGARWHRLSSAAMSSIAADGVSKDDENTARALSLLAATLTLAERTSPEYAAALALVPVIDAVLGEKFGAETTTPTVSTEAPSLAEQIQQAAREARVRLHDGWQEWDQMVLLDIVKADKIAVRTTTESFDAARIIAVSGEWLTIYATLPVHIVRSQIVRMTTYPR